MQNRNPNIDERLQILNDYIQRTIDALNMTRQVAQGLTSSYGMGTGVGVQNPVGFSHTGFVPQFVQTPYGIVPVSQLQSQLGQLGQVGQVGQLGQFGLGGVPQTLGLNYGLGYGLSHTHLMPQQINPQFGSQLGSTINPQFGSQFGSPWQMPFGLPQVMPQIAGFNYGMTGNLSHTGFVPQWVSPFAHNVGQSVLGQPVNVGQSVVGQPNVGQFGVSQFSPVSTWPMNVVPGVI